MNEYDYEYSLFELNSDYPQELLEKFIHSDLDVIIK